MNSIRKEKKILVVDDEPDITIAFKLALEGAGFIVDINQNPFVTLYKFTPNSYDLVILDIRMPGMNGFELHEEMLKVDPQVLVCFITAGELYYDEVRGDGKEKKKKDNTVS
jgi:two-component system, OmpR family, response regulator ChvI